MTQQILLVDDDPVQRRLLEAHVSRMGYGALSCDNGRSALDLLKLAPPGRRPAAMVLDLAMPGLGGVEVMAEMRRAGFDVPVVVQTATGSIDAAVEAMRAGAFDFVVKPASPAKLQAVIERAVGRSAARRGGRSAGGPDAVRLEAGGAAMRAVIAQARRAAGSTIPILIEGETGAGKEWLAEAIRAVGPRAGKPFVAVNCGALPGALAESILFGHAKGAFTDASERRPGKFVEADGGTLFLDEIGELTPAVQAKLLRVLQNGEVDPVGGGGPVPTDVRVLSATNRDLEAEVAAGRFRQDLYFRLNVLTIRVPPLRERRDEIDALAVGLLKRIDAAERAGAPHRFAPGVLEGLRGFEWPGNIRQLENAIHRAAVLAEGDELRAEDFPQISLRAQEPEAGAAASAEPASAVEASTVPNAPAAQTSAPEPTLTPFGTDGEIRRADAVEADLIRLALLRYGGRMSEVARRLGIGRSTLYRKIREYRLEAERAG